MRRRRRGRPARSVRPLRGRKRGRERNVFRAGQPRRIDVETGDARGLRRVVIAEIETVEIGRNEAVLENRTCALPKGDCC